MKMKKQIITLTIAAALVTTNISAYAAAIPRESVPLNATEQQIQITENIISDILDEVQNGKLGYTADLITDVQNGKDYNTAYEESRIKIYKSTDASFNPDTDMVGDFCYWNVPPVDSSEFTVARKLLLNAQK